MAIKDDLKHFRDYDDYAGSLTKKELDDNLDLIADSIGLKTDGTTVTQQGSESKICIGSNCTASGDYSLAFGYECTASGDCSLAFGDTCTASGVYSYAFGDTCTASGMYSQAFGGNFENKQPMSQAFGLGNPNDSTTKQNLKHFDLIKTTDDTQTNFYFPIALWIKSLNYIIVKCEAIKDDYSTKWIFERKLIVRVDAAGNVTIDSDTNDDIVKDDADWAFDITSTNDATNPTLTLKATGKASTTIAWGVEVENRQTYFAT